MVFVLGQGLVSVLAEHRHPALTLLLQLVSLLGEVEGYVALVALVYVAFDKRFAIQLAIVTLGAMTANHLLKTALRIPRPFVAEGTWAISWAVSPARAADLVTEYSTPSGHAMASSAFYTYLHQRVGNPAVRAACVVLLLATGLCRPYLGVHYLGDVLLGWLLGGLLALLALRHGERIERVWSGLSPVQQIAIGLAASLLPWLATRAAAGWRAPDQPTAFVGYLGFLFGIVVARPLEERLVNFEPRSGSLWSKALRWLLTVTLVLGTLALLRSVASRLGVEATPLGDALRFVRYASAGLVAMVGAPLLFVRVGLAMRRSDALLESPRPAA
jgi:membrane-associated phospholipid phosphatase